MSDGTDTPLVERLRGSEKALREGYYSTWVGKELALEAADEIERLSREKAEAEKTIERLTESGCEKIMAMSDAQIDALCRLEGHDPDDAAKLAGNACEIALLKHDLQRAERERDEMKERCATWCDEQAAYWEDQRAPDVSHAWTVRCEGRVIAFRETAAHIRSLQSAAIQSSAPFVTGYHCKDTDYCNEQQSCSSDGQCEEGES